jgi:hypothetical protein
MIVSGDHVDGILDRISVVTLDNPYRQIANARAQQLFMAVMARKAEGYGPPDYPEHTIPIEPTDFVAWHHLFCLAEDSGLRVIGGYKTVSLSRCDYYHLLPPYLSLAQMRAETDLHAEVLMALCEERRPRGDLLFASGLTIDRSLRREHRALSMVLKQIVAALMVNNFVAHGGSPLVGAGALRFKTELLWENIGFHYITNGGVDLPAVRLLHVEMEVLRLMVMEQPSQWAIECLEIHRGLLDARLILRQGLPQKRVDEHMYKSGGEMNSAEQTSGLGGGARSPQ